MKAFTAIILVLLLSTALIGCDFSVSTAKITKAVMTTQLDEEGKYVGEVTEYHPEDLEFIVYVDVANAPADTKVTFTWVYVTQDIEIDSVELLLPGSSYATSSLTQGVNPWPVGDYEVQIFIDSQKEPAKTVSYKVVE